MAFISDLLRIMHPQLALSGSEIIRRGELGSQLFFIIRGGVSVYQAKVGFEGPRRGSTLSEMATDYDTGDRRDADENDEELVCQLVDGHFFGFESLLTSSPSKSTVRAAITTQMYVLVKSEIGRVVDTLPALAEQLQAVLRVAIAKQNEELGIDNRSKTLAKNSRWSVVRNAIPDIAGMTAYEATHGQNSLFAPLGKPTAQASRSKVAPPPRPTKKE
jgi:CRP-like cAMP-binding protein